MRSPAARSVAHSITDPPLKQCTKLEMLNFTVAHEMYHRGQLTVYERVLGIESALTHFFRKMMSPSS